MARYNGTVTNNASHYSTYIEVTESNPSIANNTSLVTVKFHIVRSSWGWQTSNRYSGSIVIDGTTTSFSYTPNWAAGTSGDVVIASASKTVTHNNDGTKSCSTSASWNTSGTYSCGTASASGTMTLQTIARASSIACSSPYIGDTATITIDRKSTSFTNTVTYNIGGITGTIATKTSDTVLSLATDTLANSIYALIPNAKQIQGTVYCTTYNGDTQIGSTTSATFNLYAKEDECKPTVTGTVVDTNATTIALTGSSSTIVKYASIPQVSITATGNKSATISSYTINTNDGQIVNQQQYTFAYGIASSVISITATDSRGFSTTVDLTPTTIDYIPVVISSFSVIRPEDVSTEIELTASGTWYNGDFSVGTSNTLTASFKYRESGSSTWINGSSVTLTTSGNTFSVTDESLGNLFSYDKEWEILFVVQDLTGYAERQDTVQKGQEVVAIGEDKVWVYGNLYLNDEEIKPDIKGMLWLTNSTTQSIPATTSTQIQYQTTYLDTTNGKLIKNGNDIVVGSGVSMVNIKAQYRDNSENNTKYIYIYKNGTNISAYSQKGNGAITINDIIPVAEGDELAIYCYLTSAQTLMGGDYHEWDHFKATIIK